LLQDPRIPLGYLRYLFGPQVDDVLRRLEAELKVAQSGGTSELLQLLIGRDAETRYRIVDPETMEVIGPAPTQQLVQVGLINRKREESRR
jgi:hypothetical protein